MKIFNWEIKKIKKEQIVELEVKDDRIELILKGDAWGSPITQIEIGQNITQLLNDLPTKLTVHEKVDVMKLFLSDITFKITEIN